jgi:hypothetical protein
MRGALKHTLPVNEFYRRVRLGAQIVMMAVRGALKHTLPVNEFYRRVRLGVPIVMMAVRGALKHILRQMGESLLHFLECYSMIIDRC